MIADEMGKTAEEKAMFLQVFTETKKGFEAEATAKGMKNKERPKLALGANAAKTFEDNPHELAAWEEDIIEALDGLPESKVHCSNLGVSALRNAINNYLVVKRMEDSYENSNSSKR